MSNLYPLFVPLAPLIAALLSSLPRRYLSEKNYKLGWWIIFSGFLTSIYLLWQLIQNPAAIHVTLFNSPWEFLPIVELSIDRLSAVMMVVISGFGTLLYRYSTRYLQQDDGQGRYQTLLTLAVSSLLFMVSSADLLVLFICWQVLSWFLCLLSHNYAHAPTAQSCFRTFIMLRAGDLAFLAGIALAYNIYGSIQFSQIFERAALDQTSFSLFGTGFEISAATAIALLIFIGAMSKSAQFPLHMWLPDSLYAPTPIHALLHAGIINAGGFLLNRLAPLYALSPQALHVVLVIGLITAILGSSMMLVQNDIKKTLGYSTIGQMGYMIMECGLGAFSLAVFHLIAHGLFKADIFLNCGKGIHEARLHPTRAPQIQGEPEGKSAGWLAAFVLSFIVPLVITVGGHYLLGISFLDSQGLLILLLFSWVTASQAMLTLFRLRKDFLTKGSMLVGIGLVAVGYFFAAEEFTHFLIPNPHVVEGYLEAAELPQGIFLGLTVVLVLSIVLGWFFSVSRQQGDKAASGARSMYLFLINRLYLDGFALRLFNTLKGIGRKLSQSTLVSIIVAAFGLFFAYGQMTGGLPAVSMKTGVLLLLAALTVPLFPFHKAYVTLLTKAPRQLATMLGALLPVLGVAMMIYLVPELPQGILPAISVLAIVGALWGSIKALMQDRVSHLLSYGGLALYSVLWWYFAQTGSVTSHSILYAGTLTLAWTGLFFAWGRVRARYGDLSLNQVGGLFQPMPRFATCMGLLVMAAVGLPPFGLFFGYMGIILSPATGVSFALFAIIATWFLACWYLFKLMQRLLFGPCRDDLHYEDLRPYEVLIFVIVIALLVIPSAIPQDRLMEVTQWIQ